MEEPNVNRLNNIPNFGHGLPADGVVIAGLTDVAQVEPLAEQEKTNMADETVETHEKGQENESEAEGSEEKDNG